MTRPLSSKAVPTPEQSFKKAPVTAQINGTGTLAKIREVRAEPKCMCPVLIAFVIPVCLERQALVYCNGINC